MVAFKRKMKEERKIEFLEANHNTKTDKAEKPVNLYLVFLMVKMVPLIYQGSTHAPLIFTQNGQIGVFYSFESFFFLSFSLSLYLHTSYVYRTKHL
jgi:hypothetical protein